MRGLRKWAGQASAMMTLTVAGVLALGGVAVADDISNNLDTSIDAVAESMALNVGGADGKTTLYVNSTGSGPTPEDGKSGCNLTGSTTLGVSVTSSDTSVATVSPASATFTGCGDTKQLTVHAVAAGTATITVSQTSNNTGGTFDFAPATFTVNVTAPAPANAAPVIVVDGVEPGVSYSKGSVPAATCKVTDAEDGPSSFPAALSGILDADGLGSQTASCSYTDTGTPGLTASASETYSIVDPTAPVIDYTLNPSGPDGTNGWYTGEVTLTWQVSDPQSPNSLQVTSGCVDQTIDTDQDVTTYSCSATSSGGVSGPVNVAIKRDGNGPSVSYTSATGTPGNSDWYLSPVTATFTATDGFSGVAGSSTGTTTSTTDGAAVVLDSPAFSDDAGNATATGAAKSPAFKIDTVAPSVGNAVLSGTPNAAGWHKTVVTASFTATDSTSGVAGDNPKTVSTGSDQGEITLSSPAFSDVAGNSTAAGAKSATVKVDTVAPSVALVDGPAEAGSYYYGSVPEAPTCTASDATSGLAGDCSISGYRTSVGTHTVVASATDRAGNVSTSEHTYTVLAWTTKGYYSPVDMGGVWNSVKGGSTVPLKFEVFAGTELTSTSTVASFVARAVACPGSSASVDPIETVLTGGTILRYDSTGGQFIQNWQTPKKPGTCAQAITTMQDGSAITANFMFK